MRVMFNPLPQNHLHHINSNPYDFRARNILEVDKDTHDNLHGKGGVDLRYLNEYVMYKLDTEQDKQLDISRIITSYKNYKYCGQVDY